MNEIRGNRLVEEAAAAGSCSFFRRVPRGVAFRDLNRRLESD